MLYFCVKVRQRFSREVVLIERSGEAERTWFGVESRG